jgi:uncharacterized repeat protein (TIGR03803 family)
MASHDRGTAFGLLTAAFLLAPTVAMAQPVPSGSSPGKYSFAIVHSFTGPPDGSDPAWGVTMDAAGELYGATILGGDAGCSVIPYTVGCGVVFEVDTSGGETVLHTFTSAKARRDGVYPFVSPLTLANPSLTGIRFYGTTYVGGRAAHCYRGNSYGCGTIYELGGAGRETVLYDFAGNLDGKGPWGNLVRDPSGKLYGATYVGGANNFGTIFAFDANGAESVLHTFSGGNDGGNPMSGVIRDDAGNLYGTTHCGGVAPCPNGFGTVFKVDTGGTFTTLYSFTGKTDGGNPEGGVIADTAGNLFGATAGGGDGACSGENVSGCGVVFELDSAGNETVLHTFTGSPDGNSPTANVVMDNRGNLYGTTLFGGDSACSDGNGLGCGMAFEVTGSGTEKVLHVFTAGAADGSRPFGALVRDEAGNLYGTTEAGGSAGNGTVFKLTPPHR